MSSPDPDVSVYEEAWESRWRLTICEVDVNGLVERWFLMEASREWGTVAELLHDVVRPEYRIMAVEELEL